MYKELFIQEDNHVLDRSQDLRLSTKRAIGFAQLDEGTQNVYRSESKLERAEVTRTHRSLVGTQGRHLSC